MTKNTRPCPNLSKYLDRINEWSWQIMIEWSFIYFRDLGGSPNNYIIHFVTWSGWSICNILVSYSTLTSIACAHKPWEQYQNSMLTQSILSFTSKWVSGRMVIWGFVQPWISSLTIAGFIDNKTLENNQAFPDITCRFGCSLQLHQNDHLHHKIV